MSPEKVLVILLRLKTVVLGSAILAVFWPYSWMDGIHRGLQMGPLPAEPVVGYMARTLAAFYASYGVLAWMTSLEVRRFLPIVKYQGWFAIVFGVIALGVDWVEQMPTWWTLAEGPFLIPIGALLLWLSHRVSMGPVEALDKPARPN